MFGARPLKRVIQRQIENLFSQKILNEEFQSGDHIQISVTKGELILRKTDKSVENKAA